MSKMALFAPTRTQPYSFLNSINFILLKYKILIISHTHTHARIEPCWIQSQVTNLSDSIWQPKLKNTNI